MAEPVDRKSIAAAQRAGATRTAIEPTFIQRVLQGVKYMITGAGPEAWFGPFQPLAPQAPPEVAGRQFDYPVGYNLTVTPRGNEAVSFAQLRSIADGYDLLRLVIETRKDQMERLTWNIRPRALANAKPASDRLDDPRIGAIEEFFRMPDRINFWSTWLRQLLEDLFVVDAPALFIRRTRGGQLYALEPIDGTTVKRLITADGRSPLPPEPAYQQVLHGLPAVDLTTRDLIYRPRNARSHKLYGYSPVEQVLMTVNIALRRQLFQLSYYTEGNVPEALIGTPESWSPQQIKEFQQYWDALLEGNLAQRRHAKFVPGGVAKTFIATKDDELKNVFDEWLARVICFAFSISPQPFAGMMNRATAETAHDAAVAEGLAPVQNWVKQLIDYILVTEFAAPDLEFAWCDDREVDPETLANIARTYVTTGIKTIKEARHDIGLDPVEHGDTPMVFTGSGPVPLGGNAANGNAALVASGDKHAVSKFSADQPRDEHGRWTSVGGNARPGVHAQADGVVVHSGDEISVGRGAGATVHVLGSDGTTLVYGGIDPATAPAVGTRVTSGDRLGDLVASSDDRHVEREPLPPPERPNIPGTNIPDESIPEEGRVHPLGPTPHENEDPEIHGAQVPAPQIDLPHGELTQFPPSPLPKAPRPRR
jgi:hypothetical protein